MTDAEVRAHLDALAKPRGSLGRLEDLAVQLCVRQQTLTPNTRPRRLIIFAGDHGLVAEGVSLWPSAVSTAVVNAILAGKAASSALAISTRTDVHVVDVGLTTPPEPHERLVNLNVRRGTRNAAVEPAMTPNEFVFAWNAGRLEAERARDDGVRLLAIGEVGIGNTTSAAALAVTLAGLPVEQAIGSGAGATPESLARKTAVVRKLAENLQDEPDPRRIAAAVGGLEIVAMAGCFVSAVRFGLTVVLDGYIATAAALIAERLHPGTVPHLIAALVSAEQGHGALLKTLGLNPFLTDWQLRLGEGTGALLLFPLLDAAAAIVTDMARLADL